MILKNKEMGVKMKSFKTPNWVRDAIFYQIFPDRFARSKCIFRPSNLEPWDSPPTVYGFKGGDLLGVVKNLDYLQYLGVTAIYFNPIFKSTANHRYHTYDYYQVDPLLGGNNALRILLDEAHKRDMHVILDGVFNHTSRGFLQFNHIVENGSASPYANWFIIKNYPLKPFDSSSRQHGYESWENLPALPKLNIANPTVREFIWDIACYWIEFGIDGWRLDVPYEIKDDEFWREFRHRVKSVNPEAYIVGEVWEEAQHWLQGDQFDAVMNYLFTKTCLGFFIGDNLLRSGVSQCAYKRINTLGAQSFADEINKILNLYPRSVTDVQFNLLGSHDTPRFKTLSRGDTKAYKLATLFQMTYPGSPSIYYGDEIGMEGNHDPGCRGGFPWDESKWDKDLQEYVRRCIALRKAYPALRYGKFTFLLVQSDIVAYCRQLGSETLIVILNNSHKQIKIDLFMKNYLEDGVLLKNVWNDNKLVVIKGYVKGISVPSRSGVVLKAIRIGSR